MSRHSYFRVRVPSAASRCRAGGGVVCPMCEITAPLTNLWLERGNAMMQRFWGQLPVEQASAFFWYVNESDWRKMVHNFKYYGAWRTAYNLGRWYGPA